MSTPKFNDETTGDEVVARFKEQVLGLTGTAPTDIARWLTSTFAYFCSPVLITGVAHTGLGGATAIALARGGVKTLILAARYEQRAKETIEAVKRVNPAVTVLFLSLDLASLSSVRAAAEQILANPAVPSIDVLINNAGVCYAGDAPRITADGLEEMCAVCHVGHWLLTSLLMPKLLASRGGGARVINLTSAAHSWWDGSFEDCNYAQTNSKWNGNAAYGRAKAANIVFSKGLAAKYGAQGIFSYSVNPGCTCSSVFSVLS